MSSYKQTDVTMTIATALREAVQELRFLADDMGNLCASIEAQFPKTYKRIPRYGQALKAFEALQPAVEIADNHHGFDQLPDTLANTKVTIMHGRQMRQGRETSHLVRLGNARVRLAGVLSYLEGEGQDYSDLRAMIETIRDVTFPGMHG